MKVCLPIFSANLSYFTFNVEPANLYRAGRFYSLLVLFDIFLILKRNLSGFHSINIFGSPQLRKLYFPSIYFSDL